MSDSPCKLYIIKNELFIKDFYFENRIFLTVPWFHNKSDLHTYTARKLERNNQNYTPRKMTISSILLII